MSEQYWDSYHDFFANVPSAKLTKLLTRYELFKHVIDLPGDIVECGVFKGAGVFLWAHLLSIFNQYSVRRVIGFDTFSGFTDSFAFEYEYQTTQEFLESDPTYTCGNPGEIMRLAKQLKLDDRIELISGNAEESIEQYVENNPGFRVSLLNLDFDVFSPTLAALEHLYPLVVPGGIVIVDEYSVRKLGESDAVDQFFNEENIKFFHFPWSRSPRAYLVKP